MGRMYYNKSEELSSRCDQGVEMTTAKRKFGAKVGGPVHYRAWGKTKKTGLGGWEEGEYASGTIVDFSLDKKYKRTNYHLKVEDKNFEVLNQNDEPLEEGGILVINGTGGLKKKLGCMLDPETLIKKGTPICFTYEGVAEITGGEWEGEMAHSISVQFEDEMTVEEDDGSSEL